MHLYVNTYESNECANIPLFDPQNIYLVASEILSNMVDETSRISWHVEISFSVCITHVSTWDSMETIAVSLTLCEWNSVVTGGQKANTAGIEYFRCC